jgi:hypothetical protein
MVQAARDQGALEPIRMSLAGEQASSSLMQTTNSLKETEVSSMLMQHSRVVHVVYDMIVLFQGDEDLSTG